MFVPPYFCYDGIHFGNIFIYFRQKSTTYSRMRSSRSGGVNSYVGVVASTIVTGATTSRSCCHCRNLRRLNAKTLIHKMRCVGSVFFRATKLSQGISNYQVRNVVLSIAVMTMMPTTIYTYKMSGEAYAQCVRFILYILPYFVI